MAKANISMPDGLLQEVDRRAAEAGTSRSGFIQEATAHYLVDLDAKTAGDARAERILAAREAMRRVGESFPPGPSGVELIRRARDARPAWLEAEGDADE